MELPRITVVFRFRQCDNENQAGREGPLLTAPAKALICWRPFTLRKSQLSVSNEKEYCFASLVASPHSEALAGLKRPGWFNKPVGSAFADSQYLADSVFHRDDSPTCWSLRFSTAIAVMVTPPGERAWGR